MKNFIKQFSLVAALILTLSTGVVYADRTWTPPDQTGHAGQFLQTDGVNTLWASAGGGGGTITGGGALNQVTIWSGATSIIGSNNFTFDPPTGVLNMFSGGNGTFLVSPSTGEFALGYYTGGGSGTHLIMNDSTQTFRFDTGSSTHIFADGANDYYMIGDDGAFGNGTLLELNDAVHQANIKGYENTIQSAVVYTPAGAPGLDDLGFTGTFSAVYGVYPYTITIDGTGIDIIAVSGTGTLPNTGATLTNTSVSGTATVLGNVHLFGSVYALSINITSGSFNNGNTFTSNGGFSGAIGAPPTTGDTFSWTDGTTTRTGVPIATPVIPMTHSISATWGAGTGHSLGDVWTKTYTFIDGKMLALDGGIGLFGIGDIDDTAGHTKLLLNDAQFRTDLYTQDFYLRGYNNNIGIFSEITSNYSDVTLGDVSAANSTTALKVLDSIAGIKMTGVFGDSFFADMSVNYVVSMGALGVGNGTKLVIDDTFGITTIYGSAGLSVVDTSLDSWLRVDTGNSVHMTTIGDVSGNNNDTTLKVDDINSLILASLNGQFSIVDQSTTESVFAVDTDNIIIAGGDTLLTHNGFRFAIFDSLKTMDFASPDGTARFGDPDSSGNDTIFALNDDTMQFAFKTNGEFVIQNVGAGATWFNTNPTAGTGCWGDCDNIFNSSQITFNDSTSTWQIQGTSLVVGMTKTRINGNLKQPSIIQVAYGVTSDFSAEPDFQGRSMILVSGSTGATTILLPTGTVAIPGTLITIKDHDLIASTSNITVDAGSGSTIKAAASAQTFVMNANGKGITLIKSTSNTWDVISSTN